MLKKSCTQHSIDLPKAFIICLQDHTKNFRYNGDHVCKSLKIHFKVFYPFFKQILIKKYWVIYKQCYGNPTLKSVLFVWGIVLKFFNPTSGGVVLHSKLVHGRIRVQFPIAFVDLIVRSFPWFSRNSHKYGLGSLRKTPRRVFHL